MQESSQHPFPSPSPSSVASEIVLEGQKRALELALRGEPLKDILDVIARTVEAQSAHGVLASILVLDPSEGKLRHGAAPHLPEDYNAAIDGLVIGPGVGSCGTAAYTGKTVVVQDIAQDPLWKDFKHLALKHGLRACWSTPIRSSRGEVLGTFALYHQEPATPSPQDLGVVELLEHTAALVIEREWQSRHLSETQTRMQAERELHNTRLVALLEHMPVAISIIRGPQYVFESVNAKARELIGRDLIGKTVREAFPELESQGYLDLIESVYKTGKAFTGRGQRALYRKGESEELVEGFFDILYQPIPGPDGIEGVLSVSIEVTELMLAKLEAEAARARAEASEASLRRFIDHLPGLAWTAQPDGYIDYYNQRWYEYTGTTFEEMQGWGWEKVHDPELLPEVITRWKHSLTTGEPFEMEFTLRSAEGDQRWFLTRVAPLRDSGGRIERWFGTNTDIHDLKAAHALSEAMAAQSLDVQELLLTMRGDKERAEREASETRQRVAELEARLAAYESAAAAEPGPS